MIKYSTFEMRYYFSTQKKITMFKIKILLISFILLLPSTHYGQHTDQINSNRPGETMSAYSVGKSVIQIETGVYGIKQKHSLLNYNSKLTETNTL